MLELIMNTRMSRTLCSLGVGISLLLCACGGSETQISGIDGSGAPATSSIVSTGAINGFGSVIVNGVHYNSDKAKILIDDQVVTEDSLRAGYQVKITSTFNASGAAVADAIEFHPNLVGPINQINRTTQQFTVLDHTVQVNNATVFDNAITPNYLDGLKLGDLVLVSGSVDDKGVVIATRVELSASAKREALGYVSNLNEITSTFSLHTLFVNYSGAELINFENNQIKNNLWIQATGSIDSNGIFKAKTLTRIDNSFDKSVKSAEAEGFITRYVSPTDFDVAGIKVSTNMQTSFANGTQANLGVGTALTIKGDINSAGVLVLQQVEFQSASENEVVGEVTDVQGSSNTSIATGIFKIGNTSIQTNSRTLFEDRGNMPTRRFNFNDIRTGDFLKVAGYTSQNIFVATKIERQQFQTNNEIGLRFEGIISNPQEHSFMLYDRIIVTNSETQIRGNNGDMLSEAQFFAQAAGKHVRVEGLLKNGIFTARWIEIAQMEGFKKF